MFATPGIAHWNLLLPQPLSAHHARTFAGDATQLDVDCPLAVLELVDGKLIQRGGGAESVGRPASASSSASVARFPGM
jgi:hypothetical protein